jgi:hypothetical protein
MKFHNRIWLTCQQDQDKAGHSLAIDTAFISSLKPIVSADLGVVQ